MAELMDCPDCHTPLSRTAYSCPSCGCTELKNGARLRVLLGVLLLSLIFLAILVLASLMLGR